MSFGKTRAKKQFNRVCVNFVTKVRGMIDSIARQISERLLLKQVNPDRGDIGPGDAGALRLRPALALAVGRN